MQLEILYLEIAKDVQVLALKDGLTTEAALKKIAIEYSRKENLYGRKKNVFKNNN